MLGYTNVAFLITSNVLIIRIQKRGNKAHALFPKRCDGIRHINYNLGVYSGFSIDSSKSASASISSLT